MTKKELFLEIVKLANGETMSISAEEVVTFCEGEIALLAKKSESKQNSKKKTENEQIKTIILSALTTGEKQVSELMKVEGLTAYSNQKLTALLKLLREEGKVTRNKDKKKAIYSLVETVVEELEEEEKIITE